MKRLLVRNTRQEDIPELIRLQRRVYPDIPSWSRRDLGHQLEAFPQGQFVVEHDGQLAGYASSLIVLRDDWSGEHTWQDVTAAGTFDSHNPNGRTLRGAEVFVDPNIRSAGLRQALYEGRRAICRQSNSSPAAVCRAMASTRTRCHPRRDPPVIARIAAEGTPNVEQIVIADVNIDNLTLNRVSGTTSTTTKSNLLC